MLKLLLCSDLHIGRTPARLPPAWRPAARTAAVWDALVQSACRENVHAVILGGDVVDAENGFWEALGPLESGVQTLANAGIRTIAVAGNHDATVLPRLAALLPAEHFTLLGRQGTWEDLLLHENHTPVLRLRGWSFPRTHFPDDPLDTFPPLPADGIPTLGIVHGDLGAGASHYAPLSLSRLQQQPLAGWLLGHLHNPTPRTGTPWVLMPGTPQPLDPSETGAHHAWLTQLEDGSLTQPVPIWSAPLRYHPLEIRLTPDMPPGEDLLRQHILDALQDLNASQTVLRISLTGETPDPALIDTLIENLRDWSPGGHAIIERIRNHTHPPIDPEACEQLGGIHAMLARLCTDAPPQALHAHLRQITAEIQRQREFDGKQLPPATPPDPRHLAETLLHRLLREAAP